MALKNSAAAVGFLLAISLAGCSPHRVPASPVLPPAAASTGYIDLRPGWRLRVVTPLLKSGGYRVPLKIEQVNDSAITVSAGSDFLGYETSYYAVKQNRSGVRIEFLSAEVTKEGHATVQSRPVVRLFRLPRRMKFIRLIYLTRLSGADHDMAIVATDRAQSLDAFTRQVQAAPEQACKAGRGHSCLWIPAGIAVRPEIKKHTGGLEQWTPVI